MRRPYFAASAMIAAASLALAGTASAKDGTAASAGEKINMVIIYGNDSCPVSTESDITVCARKDEAERYRIPAPFREVATPQNEAWTNRVIAYETVGAAGSQSCSATGAGGWTGCSSKLIHEAFAEKKTSSDVQFSKLIDQERQKRLSTIDKQAAETQSDVEQAEAAYDARQRAEAARKAGVEARPAQ